MNRNEILRALTALLDGVVVHENLIQELLGLVEKSGFEKKFFQLLLVRLKFLHVQGINAIQHQEFEALAHTTEELYSMHLSGKGFNIRILYAFLPDGSPALLLGFSEKSGKRVTAYESHIPVAVERLLSMRGGTQQ